MAKSVSSSETSLVPYIQPQNESQECPISHIPYELMMNIFRFIPELKEVPKIERVCKFFQAVSGENALWKIRLQNLFTNVIPQFGLLDSLSIRQQMYLHMKAFQNYSESLRNNRAYILEHMKKIEVIGNGEGPADRAWNCYTKAEMAMYHHQVMNSEIPNYKAEAEDLHEFQKKFGLSPSDIDYNLLFNNPDRYFYEQLESTIFAVTQYKSDNFTGMSEIDICKFVLTQIHPKKTQNHFNIFNNQKKFIESIKSRSIE